MKKLFVILSMFFIFNTNAAMLSHESGKEIMRPDDPCLEYAVNNALAEIQYYNLSSSEFCDLYTYYYNFCVDSGGAAMDAVFL